MKYNLTLNRKSLEVNDYQEEIKKDVISHYILKCNVLYVYPMNFSVNRYTEIYNVKIESMDSIIIFTGFIQDKNTEDVSYIYVKGVISEIED